MVTIDVRNTIAHIRIHIWPRY